MMAGPEGSRTTLRWSVGLATASILIFAVCIDRRVGGATQARDADDVATAAAALLAALLCARAAARYAGRLRLSWSLFAAACGAWAVGELIWGYYDLAHGSVPVPSWADAAYLSAIPFAAAALIAHPAMRGRAIGTVRSVLDGIVLAVALFFISWTLVLEPLQRTSDLSSLGGAVTVAYPLGDFVILFLVVLVIRGTISGDRLDLWFLVGGLIAITSSDSLFAYLTQVKHYESGDLIDTGWFAGYLAIAVAARFARSERRAHSRVSSPTLSSAAVVGPFFPLLGALTFAAVRVELGYRLDRVAMTAALTLAMLVLIRQALLMVDLFAPARRRETPVSQRLVAAIGGPITDDVAEPPSSSHWATP